MNKRGDQDGARIREYGVRAPSLRELPHIKATPVAEGSDPIFPNSSSVPDLLPSFVAVIGRRGCRTWRRNRGDRQTHDFADGEFDAATVIVVVFQKLFGIVAALADAFALEGEPGAALVD